MAKRKLSQLSTATILDGAMGTLLMQSGMPAGDCPELWAVEHPDALHEIYKSYINAGSQQILAASFGANRLKLKNYGLQDRCADLNWELTQLARAAALAYGKNVQVGGDIGPTGIMMTPMGTLDFEQAVSVFAEQAEALAKGGVDFIAIETMMDLQEARAALIGAKQGCDLPIYVTMSFENERTLMGNTPAACAVVLQAMGASAIGCNCGGPPEEMIRVIEEMATVSRLPIIAKPNAGKPIATDGAARYSMSPEAFATGVLSLAEAGARLLGGCCGTSPAHIAALQKALGGIRFLPQQKNKEPMLAGARIALPFVEAIMIGNIRADANPDLLTALQAEDYDAVCDAASQMDSAQVFCLCAVADGIDEQKALPGMARALSASTPQPLAFRPASLSALEISLREYTGRALVILDCVESQNRPAMLELTKKYGAMTIL